MTPRRAVSLALVLCVSLVATRLSASENELYGKPLRGLTAVPIAELKQAPAKYRDKAVRVVGTAGSVAGAEAILADGAVSIGMRADGFTLPAKLAGARVIAEGKLKEGVLVATGIEVTR